MILKTTVYTRRILICLSLLAANSVFAKGVISLGAASSYNYDSNVFKTSTNVEPAQYYLIVPRAAAALNISKLSFRTGYVGRFSFYQDSPENDYQDLTGSGSLTWKANERHGFDINGSYSNTHLPRESIETGASPNDPLEFVELFSLSIDTVFPLPKERYDLQLAVNANDSVYSGSDAEGKNKYAGKATAELRYRYSGKTSLVYGYNANGNRLKSDLYRDLDDFSQTLYVGARWLATGKTTSHALIGYEILQLNAPATSSYGGLNIDVSVVWQRKSYSKITLSASRSSKDSRYYGFGFLIDNRLGLDLSHSLTNRWSVGFRSNIYAFQAFDEYRHLGGDMSFNTRYSMTRITVGVRSGYMFRYSLTDDNSGFSGYTAAVELNLSI